MRYIPMLAIALASPACKSDLEKHLERKTHTTESMCFLAEHLSDDRAAKIVNARFEVATTLKNDFKTVGPQIGCIAKAYAKLPAIPEGLATAVVIARVRFDNESTKQLYEQVPPEVKRTALVAAVENEWVRTERYPLDFAMRELVRLDVPPAEYARALVIAFARFHNKDAEKQLAKLGPADERVVAAWRAELAANEDLDVGERGSALVATFEALTAANAQLDDAEIATVLKRCASESKLHCLAFIKRLPPARVLALHQQHAKEKWAAGAAEIVAQTTGLRRELPEILKSLATVDARSGARGPESAKHSPIKRPDPDGPVFAAYVDELTAHGEAAIPELRKALGKPGLYVPRAAARALAILDRAQLSADTTAALESYNAAYRRDEIAAFPKGTAAAAGLLALMRAGAGTVEPALLHGLSAIDPNFSRIVAIHLQKTVAVDTATDALFAFMAKKPKFRGHELATYEKLLTSYGAAASAPIVRNLERELAARKRPDALYWALKVVALRALQQVGTAAALPVVDKFTKDKSTFTETRSEMLSHKVLDEKTIPFAMLASDTRIAIEHRK